VDVLETVIKTKRPYYPSNC